MKNILFILVLLWSTCLFAQTDKIKIKKEKEKREKKAKTQYYDTRSFDLVYGQKIYSKNLYAQINTFDSLKFQSPVKFVAFGFSGYKMAFNPRHSFVLKMFWNFSIPQKIKIQDSISTNLGGFSYNFGLGKAISTKKKVLNLIIYIGFNTGFTKISNKEFGNQINPFFSPSICIQPKIIIKRFTFSILINADYDVTNPKWKNVKSPNQSISLKSFNQTGISLIGTLGYKIYNY